MGSSDYLLNIAEITFTYPPILYLCLCTLLFLAKSIPPSIRPSPPYVTWNLDHHAISSMHSMHSMFDNTEYSTGMNTNHDTVNQCYKGTIQTASATKPSTSS